MQHWFYSLKRQEQIVLLFGIVVVFSYLLYVVVLRPLSAAVERLEQKNEVASRSLNVVEALSKEYQSLKKKSESEATEGKQNLTRLIDTTVKNNTLTMTRFQPSSSGEVQVRFENAVFDNILSGLHELEVGNGIVIKDLSVTNGSAIGLVNVSVRLRQEN
jgi:general secretion pathway protein M